ncbi:MFS transporter [Lonsdalea quercina]|uniref:MFS transporter n=1 Tax=Lonsdalea quercina TaxID=71657 RepID=UPI003975398A
MHSPSTPLDAAAGAQPGFDLASRINRLHSSAGLWRFIALLSLGGFFELYDLFQTAYISSGLVAEHIFHMGKEGLFHITDQASFASATFLGLFVGASLLAPWADRLGRKMTFMYALAWYGALSFLMAMQSSAEGVILCRFLVGIGLGIELVTIDAYLSEWMPTSLRSKAFAFAFFIQFLSVPTVALMSWWLVPHAFFEISGWRWVVIAGAACSVVIWVLRKNLPESARWLAQQGRHDEAHQVLCDMEQRCGMTPQSHYVHAENTAQEPAPRGKFRDIWAPEYRQRTLMLVAMNFFQSIGFFGFGNWLPSLLSGQGAGVTQSLFYAFFITLAYPIGCLLCSLYIGRFEHKWQIVGSCLMTVVFGLLFTQQTHPLLLIACGFLITYSNAWLTISYHAYQAEIFPTRIRARAVGFCYSFSRLSTAFTSILIGLLLQHVGSVSVVIFIVFSMLMVMLSVGVWGPKTRGINLDHV